MYYNNRTMAFSEEAVTAPDNFRLLDDQDYLSTGSATSEDEQNLPLFEQLIKGKYYYLLSSFREICQ